MKKAAKAISLILVLALFAIMAMGSGSSKTESTGSAAESSTSSTSVSKPDTATASSNEENQKEEEETKPEQISAEPTYEITDTHVTVWENSIGTSWVQVIIEVTNTGSVPLFLSSGSYDLENEDGTLFDTSTLVSVYPTVIEPGERAYYYEESTLDEKPEGDLHVVPHPDIDKAKVELIRYPVSETQVKTDQYGQIKVSGRVENNTEEDESMLYVTAILYDSNKTCLGVLFTFADVSAGDKVGFECSSLALPNSITEEDIADMTVLAYPLQFQF